MTPRVFIAFLLLSNLLIAADPMCVRNYAKQGAGVVCAEHPEVYAHVHHMTNKNAQVCTRIYSDFYCENSKEYEYIQTVEGKRICTLNYNQPPVANYCESVPQFYDYVVKNPTE